MTIAEAQPGSFIPGVEERPGRSSEGYFPPGSLLRTVHRERAVGLFYGQRTTCIGAANPRTFIGTAIHFQSIVLTPFRRLARTAEVMETVIFGSRHDADCALSRARAVHGRVRGVLPVDAGVYPVGTSYSAFDPESMLWVVAVIADSAQCFFELLVRKLNLEEEDALWRDYLYLGELFGMPRAYAPRTYVEFRAWWSERLKSNDVFLTPEAYQMGYASAFQVPMPMYTTRAIKRMHNAIVLGSLPPAVRDLYGFDYTVQNQEEFDRAVRVFQALRKCSPGWISRGSSRTFYRWVAREESQRVRRNKPTPRLIVPYMGSSLEGEHFLEQSCGAAKRAEERGLA